jgi:phosphatidate cytidylyltransferase
VYAAVVLAAAFAPPIVFYALLALAGTIALGELWALRRAGLAAILELAVLLGGVAALAWIRGAERCGAAHSVAVGLPVWLLLAIGATWAADVGAYVVGSLVGRRKIAPRISPGKTWEGTFGGFGAAAVAVLGIAALFGLPRGEAALAAILIGPLAFAGDLLESWMKRRAGVKDSGTLLPGHGGMLDRIDSLLAVAPFVATLTAAACLG